MSTNNGGAVNGDKVVTGGFFDSVLTPPEWLNKSYVEKALSEFTNDADLKVNKITIIIIRNVLLFIYNRFEYYLYNWTIPTFHRTDQ